jgi:hypothetical protein
VTILREEKRASWRFIDRKQIKIDEIVNVNIRIVIEPLAKFIEGVIFDDSTRVAVVAGQVGAGRKAVTRNI